MVLTVELFLLLLAAICFGLASGNVQSRIGLVPLGLLFWVLCDLLPLLG
jgi:hypothetical protein